MAALKPAGSLFSGSAAEAPNRSGGARSTPFPGVVGRDCPSMAWPLLSLSLSVSPWSGLWGWFLARGGGAVGLPFAVFTIGWHSLAASL